MHPASPLPPSITARKSSEPLTYSPDELRNLDHLQMEKALSVDFRTAVERLNTWGLQRSVFKVRASHPQVQPGAVVEMSLGIGPVRKRFYCRVTDVVDEPDRVGFTYGTLPGHAERGEERFSAIKRADGTAHLCIEAWSEPATRIGRLAAPLLRRAQTVVTNNFYLHALDRP